MPGVREDAMICGGDRLIGMNEDSRENGMKRWMVVLLLVAGLAPGVRAIGQVALDNKDVVKMAKSGLGEEVILSVVQAQPGTYDTSPDALIELKNSGVTDHVIAAMTAKGPAVVMNDYDGLETGVYYKNRDKTEWTRVPSERVYAKSGGAFKSLATHDIIKQDMNGRLDGQKSELGLSTPYQFLIVTPEGIDGTDFTLVQLNQKKDAREFRTKTGGVFHSSEDVSKSAVPFEQKRVARHTYSITLPSGVGKGGVCVSGGGAVRIVRDGLAGEGVYVSCDGVGLGGIAADQVEEEAVDAGIAAELRVKGRGEEVTMPDEDGMVFAGGEDLDTFADAVDAGGADEDHLERAAGQGGLGGEDGRFVLAAVGVALHLDIQRGEGFLGGMADFFGKQNASGAGAEGGGFVDEVVEEIEEVVAGEEVEHGGGLAAGQDEAVEAVEFLGTADEARGCSEGGEDLGVDVVGTL